MQVKLFLNMILLARLLGIVFAAPYTPPDRTFLDRAVTNDQQGITGRILHNLFGGWKKYQVARGY